MDVAIFLYYLLCYSVGLAGLLVSLLAVFVRKTVPDRRFALFIAGMTLMVLSFTVGSQILSSRGVSGAVALGVGLVNVVADSFLVFSLPFFVHSLFPARRETALNRLWAATAGIAALAGAAAMVGAAPPSIVTVLFAGMGTAVAYATLRGFLQVVIRRKNAAESMTDGDRPRWALIVAGMTFTSVGYLPFFIVFDLFPRGFPSLTGALAPTIKVFPSFYAIVNGLYVATTVPLLVRGSRSGGPTAVRALPMDLDALDLSPREREVAALLAAGSTYRDIADRLFISLATVKTHVDRIYKKTGAANKTELSFMARDRASD